MICGTVGKVSVTLVKIYHSFTTFNVFFNLYNNCTYLGFPKTCFHNNTRPHMSIWDPFFSPTWLSLAWKWIVGKRWPRNVCSYSTRKRATKKWPWTYSLRGKIFMRLPLAFIDNLVSKFIWWPADLFFLKTKNTFKSFVSQLWIDLI